MAGLGPAGNDAHGVVPANLQNVSRAPRPTPQPGRDGRDWVILLEIDAYQMSAS